MLRAMKPLKNRLGCTLAGLLLLGIAPLAWGETTDNPYLSIVARNPFGLKPPPPPEPPKVEAPVVPPAKVVLTGIETMFGPARALFEITETEAGKQGTIRRPILREGERDGSIEVVSIDYPKGLVKIRNSGLETNVTFETPKMATAAAPGLGVPGLPLPGINPGAAGAFSQGAAAGNNAGRGGGVTVLGGASGGTPARNPGAAAGYNPAASASGYNPAAATGYNPVTSAGYNPTAAGVGTGLRSIPSRSVRTDSPAAAPIDPAQQYLMMHANAEVARSKGINYPPVPPLPGGGPPSPTAPGGEAP